MRSARARSIRTRPREISSTAWRTRPCAIPMRADRTGCRTAPEMRAASIALGSLELVPLSDGYFALDGGAMFGVVPKPLWERVAPPDARNRIRMGMRPLLVRGDKTLLIDAGCGDKLDQKSADIYGFDRSRHLDHALADAGLAVADIDLVLASHLHFDHAGGFTA